jgi:hypothetical protein
MAVLSHGDAVPLHMSVAGVREFFRELHEKFFFLKKNSGDATPLQLSFLFSD